MTIKNFCLSYPYYNYNTLSNYLGKSKIAYNNEIVRVERQYIFLKPKPPVTERRLQSVVRRVTLHEADYSRDLDYWLSRPANERLAAVTLLVRQTLPKGRRLDKGKVVKRK